jgi:hypothetical protein
MPLSAVSFESYTNSAKRILTIRDRFQMHWIHTGAVATEMIELQTVRDRLNQKLVHNPMRSELAPINRQFPVSVH